ncbi:MAG TPA: cysteine--tRNA ligase [archaeon]|nr:cysteine--tRNA ligase [archaeon]
MLKVYNTLSKKAEIFKPRRANEVSMYVCGPTVYGPGHIGHARTYSAFDLIRRYLEYRGYSVKYVVNITDVHDDMITQANKEGITIFELANRNIPLFLKDLDELGIKKPTLMPRVTEHIGEIVAMVKDLQKKGFAYETDDGVYYSIQKFSGYGKLSNIKVKKSVSGKRVQTDKYEKQNPMDFALWKKAKENEPAWDSPWGKGRPGWHIECSAMSTKYLGPKIDIHGGAVDLVFPHHENEIAQSEAALGKKPFVKYWLHAGFLNVGGEKMSKSLGNYITIPQLLEKFNPRAFRYFISILHYRSRVDFSDKAIEAAQKNLYKWQGTIDGLLGIKEGTQNPKIKKEIENARSGFIKAMDSDFNLPNAWACLYKLQSELNSAISMQKISQKDVQDALVFLREINEIFGFFDFEKKEEKLSPQIMGLIEMREKYRKEKDFASSDLIRSQLLEKGIELIDTAQGIRWKIAKKTIGKN